MYRKFSLVRYGCQLLCAPLGVGGRGGGGSLGRGARNGFCVYMCQCVSVCVGQGDASCGSSLNILAGNISDAFPSLFHHSLPSCFPFSNIFLCLLLFFPPAWCDEQTIRTVVTVFFSALSTNTWFSSSP